MTPSRQVVSGRGGAGEFDRFAAAAKARLGTHSNSESGMRMRQALDKRHGRRMWGVAIAALTTGLVIAGASFAGVAQADPEPRVEVAPGVYLAAASELESTERPTRRQDGAGAASGAGTVKPRITGGSATKISRWPWQVSIGYLHPFPNNDRKNHICGGTLVAPTIAISAAHCFTLGSPEFRPPEEFRVVTGRTKLSGHGGRRHGVANYYWFVDQQGQPLWNRDTGAWDVVFVELDSPSDRTTIKIAGPDEGVLWAPGRRAFVTGWGTTKAGTDDEIGSRTSDELREARIRMVSDSACDSVYGPIFIAEVMVCAGSRSGGADACTGDSGGPLVVPIAGGGYRLVGDVSFAEGCGLPGIPGVYGRLAADPIRTSLRAGIQAVAGVDVVGTDAQPSNQFGFGRVRQSARGRAKLTVRVPGRGQVRVKRTKQLQRAVAWPSEAGPVRVALRPRGKAKRRLARVREGKVARVRVRARVSYKPMGGERRTKSLRVILKARG